MNKLTGNQIRKKWLDFFKSKNHYVMESKSLVPINDDSLLWINSGIATLKNYFSGKNIPPSSRLTNSQRCLRTNDIENVGITSRHHTLFEMLGNFSIGDYFKNEAIQFAYELLINEYQLDKNKIYITVFKDDKETYNKWIELGINPQHIIKCDKTRNFWDLGQGPCGPCTEIYYDRGEKYDFNNIGIKLFLNDIENDRYVEIWNIVFSQYNNDGNGNYTELSRKNIDTGSGLERLASVIQDVPTNFDTDFFLPIIREIEKYSEQKYHIENYFSDNLELKKIQTYFRVIADHLKSVVFAIADGVSPGAKGRNYTIRRLIRRIVLYAKKLNLKTHWTNTVIDVIINLYSEFFSFLLDKKEIIISTLIKEIENYTKTIETTFNLFNEQIKNNSLTTKSFFKLVETYGLPIELAKEFLKDSTNMINMKINDKNNIKVNIDWNEFYQLFEKHKNISKSTNQIISIEKQNKNLLDCHVKSVFDYDNNNIEAKVIFLFDENFNPKKSIINDNGYVIFDKTVIYATSGGQRYDEGYAKNNISQTIVKFDGIFKSPNLQHLHHFNNASFSIGEKWIITHDPEWRCLVKKNHSLEHILHSALKKIISPSIKQEGAFKSAEKATLDFSYPSKLTDQQLNLIENEIRNVIAQKIPVETIYTDLEGSKKMNAIAYFDDEYKKHDKLRVIKISDYSIELCGGTHVSNTSEIEDCYITNHTSRGANSWRIEIISSYQTITKYLNNQCEEMKKELKFMLKNLEKINELKLLEKLKQFTLPTNIKDLRDRKKQFEELKQLYHVAKFNFEKNQSKYDANKLKNKLINTIQNNISIISLENYEINKINIALSNAINEINDVMFIVINNTNNKVQYIACVKNSNKKQNANEVIQLINNKYQGKGGGKENYAQGGTSQKININEVINLIKNIHN